jgi:hypothetical protein
MSGTGKNWLKAHSKTKPINKIPLDLSGIEPGSRLIE